ncbi:hypothetical protein BDZ85DRAFT_283595 [Elsinoe ampelina]|uniref:Uncharacterized protein n=1 Tax=Elsinoe ampelina TaxID=302913 RepID=A0A6A6G7I3_9PEZI|nr:hypothetical protein BDZ85DRAFT_283595 [Elsinoe ampelina]
MPRQQADPPHSSHDRTNHHLQDEYHPTTRSVTAPDHPTWHLDSPLDARALLKPVNGAVRCKTRHRSAMYKQLEAHPHVLERQDRDG